MPAVRAASGVVSAVGAVGLTALLLPEPALAHVANIEYRFPLPVWLYGVAGAGVVLASVPAAAVAVYRQPRLARRNLYPLFARIFPGAALRALALTLLVLVVVAGWFSPALGVENPAYLLIWVDLWVGLGLVSAVLGNVWDFVSPLSNLARSLDRALARRGLAQHEYPAAWGLWPAVVLLLAFSWFELVWLRSRDPDVTATLVAAYCVVQLVGVARYGAEVWLARAELFTVVARTFARCAPFELYRLQTRAPCPAARCPIESERLGCPACFAEAPRADRGIRRRPFGSGVLREPPLGRGGSAFVVALLATVVYDGLRGTKQYVRLEGLLVDVLPRLDRMNELRWTLAMILVVGAFALLYLGACSVISLFEQGTPVAVAQRYAPTLIPIAAVYFIAHYALYLFYLGQLTPRVVLDPTDGGWLGDYRPWTGVPGSVVWAFQVAAIVAGHVLAVIAAHRLASRFHPLRRQAIVAQLPMVALMVAYTFTGLWVLGQALQAQG